MENQKLVVGSVLLILALVFQACEPYIADPLDPRIPAYTQVGANDAACYIDGSIWRDRCSLDEGCFLWQAAYDSIEHKTKFSFNGRNLDSGEGVEINMVLQDVQVLTFSDVKRLKDRTFVFGGSNQHVAYINTGGLQNECSEIIKQYGEFTIRDIGATTLEEIEQNFFAGTFGFDYDTPCQRHEVYRGRFDVTLSTGVFVFEDF